MLAACTGYAALVLGSATWAEARALDHIFPFYPWHIRPFTAADLATLRTEMSRGAWLLASLSVGLSLLPTSRLEFSKLGGELGQSWNGLFAGLVQLTPKQRRQALAVFTVLTALRLHFSIANPEYDDAVSYEVFVSKGLLATSAYYPIPNNHVFSNTISLLFYQLSTGFWWSMRLPVLLVSTVATLFLFAALLRRAGFRVAAVTTTLFSWLQLSLYHAGVGRGYWLVILLAGIIFFSMLASATGNRPRAAWFGLVLAGVVGCYTVPTFVYVLASTFSWLAWAFIRRGQWGQLGGLAALAGLIGLAATTLYAPLLFISGFDKFTGNGYVAALEPTTFWAGLPSYIWHNEGFLAGQRTLGGLITVPVLLLLGWLVQLGRTGRLPTRQAQLLQHLAEPALWFVALPYAIIFVQRVFPPERVLLYKAFFFFIIAGIVVDWLLQQWPTHRWLRPSLTIATGLFAIYQTFTVVRVNPAARGTNAAYHAGLQWLATQPPGPTLIPEPTHNLFFRFYAHSQMQQRSWQIDNDQQGNTRYAYVVAFPNKRGFFQPLFNFPPAYHNQEVDIYKVPKSYHLDTKPWRH
ncbi:hypothetical protein [Hymenobacter terrenus]|uniref:hypothetical protein n=1 Tax=Hymenobacter terrenus TaxID=1629124 RepID=UPI000619A746|nr:hypothetical protein [Hymenobacter terrenus]